MKKKVFTLLTLLVLCVTGAWAADKTIVIGSSSGDLILNEGVYEASFSEFSVKSFTRVLVEVPSVAIDGTVSWKANGSNGSRFLYIYKNNGTVRDETRKFAYASSWETINYTSDDILTDGGKYYLVFATSDDWKTSGVRYTTVAAKPSTGTTVNAAKNYQNCVIDKTGEVTGSKTDPKVAYKLTHSTYPFAIEATTTSGSEAIQLSNTGYQLRINGNDYYPAKFGKDLTYIIKPNPGVTIKSVEAYGRSNVKDEKSHIASGANETDLDVRGNSSTVFTSPEHIALTTMEVDGIDYYYFTISNQQAIVALDVTYDIAINVDVKISFAGYATLFYDKKLVVPTGVKAYKAAVSGSNIALTDIGALIPANTGVILEATAGVYNFATTNADASAVDVSGNILIGTTTEIDTPTGAYTLGQNGGGVVGLRAYTGAKIRAYSAYSTDGALPAARDFYAFDEDVTAISKVETKKVENGVFYNLAGQQVAQPTKGLYIVNGKKVLVP